MFLCCSLFSSSFAAKKNKKTWKTKQTTGCHNKQTTKQQGKQTNCFPSATTLSEHILSEMSEKKTCHSTIFLSLPLLQQRLPVLEGPPKKTNINSIFINHNSLSIVKPIVNSRGGRSNETGCPFRCCFYFTPS